MHAEKTLPPKITVFALLLAAGALAGCHSPAGPAAPSDAKLAQAVQGKLAADTVISGEPISASVQNAVATLNGAVSNDAARLLAANDVAQVAGIRTVVNNLTVQPPPAAQTAAQLSEPPPPPVKPPAPDHHKPSAVVAKPLPAPEPERSPAPIERTAPPPVQAIAPPPAAPPAAPPVAPPPAAPAFRNLTLPVDTTLPVRITETLDSATAKIGDTFTGVIANDVVIDGMVALAQGSPVSGRVSDVQDAGHFKGNSLLTIELRRVDQRNPGEREHHLDVATDVFSKAGVGRGKNTAEKVGGGAAVGAILGSIFGGGKGAAIGAAAGGGAGAGVNAATRGEQVQIPAESLVRFHLTSPLQVRVPGDSIPRPDSSLQHHDN